ncbi:TonB-dependent receptor domain-containing protein [Halorhodospira halochloris]|uniref:TonB-dependent receptor domain-containing protein n=1 Tax=Halorhodospira halochloris TaxID=1052 RepID=UPI001EE8EDD7|nr:TonB-dependent receptor [Halorhodospira halochloris]MCG5549138.1 TonB-dependent receptor [Halorhodospira halochloris]
MHKKRVLLAGVAAGLGATSASAEMRLAVTDLETVVVTPTRTAQTVDQSLSSVSVIDRDEIDRQQPRQVSDLLQGRAGTSLTTNGPFGKDTSLFMRGTESDHTLLLVDGVRMGSATTGGASWQYLPPSEIERIEVVRGPRSSIYGADAIGGVVQVFTREGEEGPPRVNVFTGGGSFNTYEYGAGVAGGTEDTRYSLSAGHFHTDGINVQDDVGDDDDDGYTHTTASGKVSHWFTPSVEVFGNFLYAEGESDFDAEDCDFDVFPVQCQPYSSAHNEFTQVALRGGGRVSITDYWQTEISFSQSRDESDTYYENELDGYFDTRRDMASWHNEFYLGRDLDFVAGVDWRQDHVDGLSSMWSPGNDEFEEDSRYNIGAYQVLTAELGSHQLQGSLRYDDNEEFGGYTTGQLAWGWQVTDTWQTRASYGTAFKAPTFNQLYAPEYQTAWGTYRSNPNLNPEESASAELGVRWQDRQMYLDASVFQTEIDDLIANREVETDQNQFVNVNEALIRGAEAEIGAEWEDWQLSGAYTYLDHEDRETGNELRRRPNHSARLDIDRELGDFSFGATGIARGRSYDDEDNDVRLSGYGLLNLRTSYAFTPEWSLRGTLENALDKDYEMADGYNQPGRAVYVSIHFEQE